MADGTSRLLVTGAAGFTGRRLVRAAGHSGPLILGSGKLVSVNDIVEAARSVDVKAGIATVWPEFSETAK
jgi:nucleoside-diphosphate-sugar epimerase